MFHVYSSTVSNYRRVLKISSLMQIAQSSEKTHNIPDHSQMNDGKLDKGLLEAHLDKMGDREKKIHPILA